VALLAMAAAASASGAASADDASAEKAAIDMGVWKRPVFARRYRERSNWFPDDKMLGAEVLIGVQAAENIEADIRPDAEKRATLLASWVVQVAKVDGPLVSDLRTSLAEKFSGICDSPKSVSELCLWIRAQEGFEKGWCLTERTLRMEQVPLSLLAMGAAMWYLWQKAASGVNLSNKRIQQAFNILSFESSTPSGFRVGPALDNPEGAEFGQIQARMDGMIRMYRRFRRSSHPVFVAAIVHHKVLETRPFADGNERLAHMLLSFCLIREGIVAPVVIPSVSRKSRARYDYALGMADVGILSPLAMLVADATIRVQRQHMTRWGYTDVP
jgi:hypothetical protein